MYTNRYGYMHTYMYVNAYSNIQKQQEDIMMSMVELVTRELDISQSGMLIDLLNYRINEPWTYYARIETHWTVHNITCKLLHHIYNVHVLVQCELPQIPHNYKWHYHTTNSHAIPMVLATILYFILTFQLLMNVSCDQGVSPKFSCHQF